MHTKAGQVENSIIIKPGVKS